MIPIDKILELAEKYAPSVLKLLGKKKRPPPGPEVPDIELSDLKKREKP